VSDTKPVGSGEAMQVACGRTDATTFRSGVVWRDPRGAELRLMLPSDGTDDATMRPLDLDCDGEHRCCPPRRAKTATTRARGFTLARPRSATARTPTATRPRYSAVAVHQRAAVRHLDDGHRGVRSGDANRRHVLDGRYVCVHADSTAMSECRKCILSYEHGNSMANIKVCEPAIDAMIDTAGACSQTPCTVDVVATTAVGMRASRRRRKGPFAKAAIGVSSAFALRVARIDANIAMSTSSARYRSSF